MPIPGLNMDWREDSFRRNCIGQNLKLSLWPRRCHYSNKSLWLKRAYRVVAMWTGPGDPAFETRWVDRDEFLIKKIKGEL